MAEPMNVDANGNPVSGGATSAPADGAARQTRLNVTADGVPIPDVPDVAPVRHTAPVPDKERTMSEVGARAKETYKQDAADTRAEYGYLARHPVDTAKAVGQFGVDLAKGVASKGVGAIGVKQDPQAKAAAEGVLNALIDSPHPWLKALTGDTKDLKNELAERPVHALLDVASMLPVVGQVGKGIKTVGEVSKIPGLARAASAVTKASELANPANLAAKVAGKVGEAAMYVPRTAAWVASGVPVKVQKTISSVARGTKAQKAAFAVSNSGDARPLFNAALGAYNDIINKNVATHEAKIAAMGAGAPKMDWGTIQQEVNDARVSYSAHGPRTLEYEEEHKALDKIEALIASKVAYQNRYRIAPTFLDFNKIKETIKDIGHLDTGSKNPAAMRIYHKINSELESKHPDYMTEMRASQDQIAHMKAIASATGARPGGNEVAALAKMMRSEKSPSGRLLIDELSARDPMIPFMLAGHATSEWARHGAFADLVRHTVGPASVYGGFVPSAIGALAASSPKLIGKANYAIGRAAAGLNSAANAAPAVAGATYLATGQQKPDASAGSGVQNTSDVFARVLQAESGNQQFDKSGATITSPKGAIGAAQIMLSTGPEAAKLAGLPWDANRLRTDAAYNRKLGHAYFNKMRKDFGDTAAALAAYNAGPGAVRRAMEKAKTTGQNFLDLLPRETQDYVHKIMGGTRAAASGGRVQRASGGRAGIDPVAEAKALCALAESSKRDHGEDTKPLLKAHDDTITNALAIASKTI